MICDFRKKYSFLSNFADSSVMLGGIIYPTVEHAFQAAKTNDVIERADIAIAETPGKAKKLGRKVTLTKDWEAIKFDIMRNLVRQKFLTDEKLMRKLLETGQKVLVEGNYWHDNTWGNCLCPKCSEIEGNNNLGKILMDVRKYLQDKVRGVLS